jgi:hypothetical protein
MREIDLLFFKDTHTWCIKKNGKRVFRGTGNPYLDSTYSANINSEVGDEVGSELEHVFNQYGFKGRPLMIHTYDDCCILIKGSLYDTGEKISNMLRNMVNEIETKKEAHP